MALERLLVLEDRLESAVANRDLGPALMTLGRGQAKCEVRAALRTVVSMVLLNVAILLCLAKLLYILRLYLVFIAEVSF